MKVFLGRHGNKNLGNMPIIDVSFQQIHLLSNSNRCRLPYLMVNNFSVTFIGVNAIMGHIRMSLSWQVFVYEEALVAVPDIHFLPI